MEHSLVQPVPSPWRARAFVAAAIAGLEAVVILVAAVVLVARPLSHRIRHDATAAAAKPAPVAKHPHRAKAAASDHAMLSRGETTVLVLNGNGQQGAAGTQAAQIRNLGYPVKGVGNAKRMNFGRTVVMYRPGYAGEARRLAHDARIALVGPLDGLSVSDLAGARIAIVVGSSS